MNAIAPDDVVATHAAAAGAAREPLLVVEPLRAFLDEHGLGAGDLRVAPIGDGHSNVTYLVARDGCEVVLRRPPRGPLAPSTHDVLREARLLRALQDTAARVPRVLAVCDDASVIGAPFYVMERIAGEVVTRDAAARARHARRAPALRGGARRRARRDPRGRLARVRPGGVHARPGRLPRPPAAALRRAVGAPPHARRAGGARGRRVAA